jgi:hypothetical protein
LDLVEVSLVDQGAHEAARVDLVRTRRATARASLATRAAVAALEAVDARAARVGTISPPVPAEGGGSPPERVRTAVPYDPTPPAAPDAPDLTTGPGPRSIYDKACPACGKPLDTCSVCQPTRKVSGAADLLKMSRALDLARGDTEAALRMVKAERAQGLRKLRAVEAGAQGLAKRLDKAEAARRTAEAKLRATEAALFKASAKGFPKGFAVSKAADAAGRQAEPESSAGGRTDLGTPRDLIRQAHRTPYVR